MIMKNDIADGRDKKATIDQGGTIVIEGEVEGIIRPNDIKWIIQDTIITIDQEGIEEKDQHHLHHNMRVDHIDIM